MVEVDVHQLQKIITNLGEHYVHQVVQDIHLQDGLVIHQKQLQMEQQQHNGK